MKRREVDQLVDDELAGPYYHATSEPLPIGAVLQSRGSQGWTPIEVDTATPNGVPRRNKHLFMVRDPKCLDELGREPEDEFLYRVTPQAPVQRANFGWIERIVDSYKRGVPLTPELKQNLEESLLAQGWKKDTYKSWRDESGYVNPQGHFYTLDDVIREQYAKNYWTGQPTEPCKDEYLTMAFKVEERV